MSRFVLALMVFRSALAKSLVRVLMSAELDVNRDGVRYALVEDLFLKAIGAN